MKLRDIDLDLSVRLYVRVSHLEFGYFVDITSPSMEVPGGIYRSFSLKPRIVDVQRQGFSLIDQILSDLQPFENS